MLLNSAARLARRLRAQRGRRREITYASSREPYARHNHLRARSARRYYSAPRARDATVTKQECLSMRAARRARQLRMRRRRALRCRDIGGAPPYECMLVPAACRGAASAATHGGAKEHDSVDTGLPV